MPPAPRPPLTTIERLGAAQGDLRTLRWVLDVVLANGPVPLLADPPAPPALPMPDFNAILRAAWLPCEAPRPRDPLAWRPVAGVGRR